MPDQPYYQQYPVLVHKAAAEIATIAELHPANWQELPVAQRLSVLEKAGRKLASIFGTPAPRALPMELKRDTEHEIFWRVCISGASYILITREEILEDDPAKALDTYCHEYRHAYQADQVEYYEQGPDKNESSKCHALLESTGTLELWKKNLDQYLSFPDPEMATSDPETYKQLLLDYESQPVEVDASKFARAIVYAFRQFLSATGEKEGPI